MKPSADSKHIPLMGQPQIRAIFYVRCTTMFRRIMGRPRIHTVTVTGLWVCVCQVHVTETRHPQNVQYVCR